MRPDELFFGRICMRPDELFFGHVSDQMSCFSVAYVFDQMNCFRSRISTFNLEKTTQGSCNSSVRTFLNWEAAMRHSHFTVTSATVHARARKLLQETLQWKPYGTSVSVADLLDLLLLMAA